MLAVNKTLQWISLANNNISDKGAESIAASLVVNTNVRDVWLIKTRLQMLVLKS